MINNSRVYWMRKLEFNKMIKRILVIIAAVVALLAILVLTSCPLPLLPQVISNRLTNLVPQLEISIAKVSLGFGGTSIIALELSDIRASYAGQHNVYLERVLLKPVWLNMFRPGMVHSLLIESAAPVLNQSENQDNLEQEAERTIPTYQAVHGLLTSGYAANYSALRKLVFKIPRLNIPLPPALGQTQHVELTGISARLGKSREKLELIIGGKVHFHNQDSKLKVSIKDDDDGFALDAKLHNAPLQWLNAWIPDINSNMKMQLNIVSQITDFQDIPDLQFVLRSGAGEIRSNQYLYEHIHISELYIQGMVNDGLTSWQIPYISANAKYLAITANMQMNADGLDFYADNKETFDAILALKYWPHTLAYKVREWLDTHVTSGLIEKAHLQVHIPMKNYTPQLSQLKDEDIQSTLKVYGATIQYLDYMPPITEAIAIVNLDADNASVTLEEGRVLETNLRGVCEITNFSAQKTMLDFKGLLSGTAQDTIEIALIHVNEQYPLSTKSLDMLQPIRRAKGTAQTNITVSMDLSQPEETVVVTATGKATKVSVHEVMGKINLASEQLNANFADDRLKISGTVNIADTMTAQMEYAASFGDKPIQSIKISSNTAVDELKNSLGWDLSSIANGSIGLMAELDINDPEQSLPLKLTLNLKNTELYINAIGIHKSRGEGAEVLLSFPHYQFDRPSTADYKITMNQLDSAGQISLDENHWIRSIENGQTSLFNSSFTIKMLNDGGLKLYITGESLDLSNADFSRVGEQNSFLSKGLQLESKLQRLLMRNNMTLKQPIFSFACTNGSCQDVLLKGTFDDNTSLEIKSSKGNLRVFSNNAGRALTALGISKNISEGELLLIGKQQSSRAGAPIKATLTMKDYYMKKTPLVAKLLTIPSITSSAFVGLNDLLGNKGLGFKSLACDLNYQKSVLAVQDCVIDGPVISMTADGEVDMLSRQANIKGVVVPENIINSLVQAIPMIGPPLSGGENSGVIASSYTMHGKIDEELSLDLNPLSVLTPGFLRKIIG